MRIPSRPVCSKTSAPTRYSTKRRLGPASELTLPPSRLVLRKGSVFRHVSVPEQYRAVRDMHVPLPILSKPAKLGGCHRSPVSAAVRCCAPIGGEPVLRQDKTLKRNRMTCALDPNHLVQILHEAKIDALAMPSIRPQSRTRLPVR
jgi:hypothetical protein